MSSCGWATMSLPAARTIICFCSTCRARIRRLTGKAVQDELDRHGITLNKNCVPNEKRSPVQTSGVRIGTAAETTKGKTAEDFVEIAREIDRIISAM